MEIFLIMVAAVSVIFILVKWNTAASDYTKKTNQQLLDLWPLHERNVKAAKNSSESAYMAALEKSAVLMSELKRRGLLEIDYTLEEEAFDRVSNKMFSRSFEQVRTAARNNEPLAVFQLGMLFHSIKELETSYALINKSAELGEPEAQYSLGWAHMKGDELNQDAIEAAKWFLIASRNGHEQATKAVDVARKALSEESYKEAVDLAVNWSLKNIKA